MNKRAVIDEIQIHLIGELKQLEEQGKGEDPRAGEIKRLMVMFRFLPVREYGPGDVVCPGSLVELELGTTRAYYFVVPQGGGLIARIEGKPVQVITPQSPLGEVLLGKQAGDRAQVEAGGKTREYRIVAVT